MSEQTTLKRPILQAFEAFPPAEAQVLRDIRALIFSEAERLGAGQVEEILKWGQPSYRVKEGTPVRLGLLDGAPAIFVHCQTSIIEEARTVFGPDEAFSGNRALRVTEGLDAARHVIGAALTYHRRQR